MDSYADLALTQRQLETHACELSVVATDNLLVLMKHGAISTHSAD